MPAKKPIANLYILTLHALQYVEQKRRKETGADDFNYQELGFEDLKNARKDDRQQIITLIFSDGVQEEYTYLEILGTAEYHRYEWPTPTFSTGEIP